MYWLTYTPYHPWKWVLMLLQQWWFEPYVQWNLRWRWKKLVYFLLYISWVQTFWVMLLTDRQTNQCYQKWSFLTLGNFEFGIFNFGTFWLWDVFTCNRDVLILGHFDMGHFDFGTFWPLCSHFFSLPGFWLKMLKIYTGRFDKSLGLFLVLLRFGWIPCCGTHSKLF